MCAMQKPEDYYPKSKQGKQGGPPRSSQGGGGPVGRSSPPGGGGPGPEWPPKFEYQSGYFFESGHIKESLLTSFAEEQAEAFLRPPRLNSAQLRRFYHEVKALEAKIAAGGESGFEANYPLVKMLRSKVAYACPPRGQGNQKVPESFAKFMWRHVEQIRTIKDFEAFAKVFEAVTGFFYGKGGGRQ